MFSSNNIVSIAVEPIYPEIGSHWTWINSVPTAKKGQASLHIQRISTSKFIIYNILG